MIILAIETSCDDTSFALVKDGKIIISNIVSSQINIHKKYGGVVPELASRAHLENIDIVLDEVFRQSGSNISSVDYVAVTKEPGLIGSLLVGITYARALSFALDKPLIYVNHVIAHLYAAFITNEIESPFISLIASGGHSHLILHKNYFDCKMVGKTRDDASGEAFDKIARFLGLSYPGGPEIEKLSINGNKDAIRFPRVYFKDSFDFSFSGLKTGVVNFVERAKMNGVYVADEDVAASFQEAVVDVLSTNLIKAAHYYSVKNISIGGGVSCNESLRDAISKLAVEHELNFFLPEKQYSTDNAAMVGVAAYYSLKDSHLKRAIELN